MVAWCTSSPIYFSLFTRVLLFVGDDACVLITYSQRGRPFIMRFHQLISSVDFISWVQREQTLVSNRKYADTLAISVADYRPASLRWCDLRLVACESGGQEHDRPIFLVVKHPSRFRPVEHSAFSTVQGWKRRLRQLGPGLHLGWSRLANEVVGALSISGVLGRSIDSRGPETTWNQWGHNFHDFHASVDCCLVLLYREIAWSLDQQAIPATPIEPGKRVGWR